MSDAHENSICIHFVHINHILEHIFDPTCMYTMLRNLMNRTSEKSQIWFQNVRENRKKNAHESVAARVIRALPSNHSEMLEGEPSWPPPV